MINYQAPNPYPKNESIFASLFSIFSSASSSTSIGTLILPAQGRKPQSLSSDVIRSISRQYPLTIDGGYVGTHDGAVLDTIQFDPQSEAKSDESSKRYIIKFNGNGGQYQDSAREYAVDAVNLGASVIGFNYRGVGNSTGKPKKFQDLVTDGIAQVQRLLDGGADPKNITLDGISLGGSVATMVASHFHKLDKRVSLWNDRSFATLPKAAAGMVIADSAADVSFSSAESSSSSIMKTTGWSVDVATAYNSIPAEYKSYMVVAEKSSTSTGDGVIAHRASLHYAIKEKEKKQGINTGHVVLSKGYYGGHNELRQSLVSAEDTKVNGQMLFEKFVLRNQVKLEERKKMSYAF